MDDGTSTILIVVGVFVGFIFCGVYFYAICGCDCSNSSEIPSPGPVGSNRNQIIRRVVPINESTNCPSPGPGPVRSTWNQISRLGVPINESAEDPEIAQRPQPSQTTITGYQSTFQEDVVLEIDQPVTSLTPHQLQSQPQPHVPLRLQTNSLTQSTLEEPLSSSLNLDELPSFALTGKHGEEICPVCYDQLREKMVSVGQCLHFVHTACLKQWLSRDKAQSCPVCRVKYEI